MDLNKLAARQYDWVDRMNWHNKTVLESLALIGSEIGEAADECFGDEPSATFGEELADIFLRIADLAQCEKIDLEKITANVQLNWRSKSIPESMSELTIDWAKWINTARKEKLEENFATQMGIVLKRVFVIAKNSNINLEFEIERKMQINEERGTRGRRI